MDHSKQTDNELLARLCELNQKAVIDALDTDESLCFLMFRGVEIQNFLSDVRAFDAVYPDHIEAYLEKLNHLLMQAANKENPMDGWVPEVFIIS